MDRVPNPWNGSPPTSSEDIFFEVLGLVSCPTGLSSILFKPTKTNPDTTSPLLKTYEL